jgi:REP element-mobilizing transposase RayT
MYLDLVAKYKEQHKFKLYSYSLFSDRLYLLIETGDDATISDIMHDLNSLYTKYFNGKYDRRGHLFESRFKSTLVEKAQHLASMTRHIHRSEAVESSYSFYMDPSLAGTVPMGDEIAEVEAFLKSKDDSMAYAKFCLTGGEEAEALAKSLSRGSVLGSEEFKRLVRDRVAAKDAAKEAAKEGAVVKPAVNHFAVFMIGALVLVASSSAVYLYVKQAETEKKYQALLAQKEAEFIQKTSFENRSPLALTELEGTEWDIEFVRAGAAVQEKLGTARLHFSGKRFGFSGAFAEGFAPTNYTVTVQPNGFVTWETIQSNAAGDTMSWRGDWKGDAMKGAISFTPAGEKARDFSFYSSGWRYSK